MAVMNSDRIQDINLYMLQRGAPIDRDGVGYNKPDWVRMDTIGRLCVQLDDEECLACLDTLLHYKNTQLSYIANELQESYNHYHAEVMKNCFDELDLMMVLENARAGGSHPRKDYAKDELLLLDHNMSEGTVTIGFPSYVDDINPGKFGARWVRTFSGKSGLMVSYDNLLRLLEGCKDVGAYGFQPNAELQKIVDSLDLLKKGLADAKAKEDAIPVVLSVDSPEKNNYGNYQYLLNRAGRDFISFLWEAKAKHTCLSFVEAVSTNPPVTRISVRRDDRKRLLSFCEKEGIDATVVQKQLAAEEYAKEHKNDSGNTLIDVSSLPLPFTPYPFQIEDAKEIVSRKKALIGHEMGCGKTFIASLVGMSIPTPKLVICPASLRLNWFRELQRFDPNADTRVVYSKDGIPEFGKDWTIMGYETATKFRNQILAKRIDCVFCDESHSIKAVNSKGEPSSNRAKAVSEVTKYATYTYLMTGTPIPTRPKDLYNELCVLGIRDYEKQYDFYRYGERYCGAYRTDFGWNCEGASNIEELHDVLSTVMTRRLKKDVLPNLTKQRQFIPLDEISKEYKDIEKRLYNPKDDDTYMGLAMTGRRVLSKVKIKPTLDLAQTFLDSGEPVVIVTEFNETMDAFLDAYTDKDGVCHASFIRGGMQDEEKQKNIDDFQSGKTQVCILNTIAGGVGITLTAAHSMIVCDYDWTPANMVQVEDRICRSGQKESCNIYYMYCEKAVLDRAFVEMITDKSAIIDAVVDSAANTVDLRTAKERNFSYLDLLKAKISAENGEKKEKKTKKPSKKTPKEEFGDN